MNRTINPSAQIYIAKLFGKIVGFIGVIHFPHALIKNMKKITRVVVLPDYQGIGIGKSLLNYVGDIYTSKGYRLTITTSHPAINKSMRAPWKLYRQGRTALIGKTGIKGFASTVTARRFTCSWEYKPLSIK